MAIQNRRGVYNNFTPSKMVPGEFAVVQSGDPNGKDGKAVYIAFATGDARRLATANDIEQEIEASTESIADALAQRFEDTVADDLEAAQTAATNANTSAQTASTKASEAAQSASQAAETVANIIDNTLTQTGKAADAKKVGDEIDSLKSDLEQIVPGLSENAKDALLACFAHVAWTDEHGQDYYDALEAALYENSYPKIVAVFDSDQKVIYTDISLNALKSYIVVTYYEDSESSGTVIAGENYTLSGVLSDGSNVITISYQDINSTIIVVARERSLPSAYTAYDYILVNQTNTSATHYEIPNAGVIKTPTYENLNDLSLEAFFKPTTGFYGGGACLIGGRSTSAYSSSVCLYVERNTMGTIIYTHGLHGDSSDTVVINKINHIKMMVGDSSPTVVKINDFSYNIEWGENVVVPSPLHLFVNKIASDTGVIYASTHIQLGETVVTNKAGNELQHLFPAVRNSDNVIGLYDTVNDTFITCPTQNYATVGNSNCKYKVGNWT